MEFKKVNESYPYQIGSFKSNILEPLYFANVQGPTYTTETGPSTAAGPGQYYYYMEAKYNNNKVARLYTNQMFKGKFQLKTSI